MAVDNEFKAFLEEVFDPVGSVTLKRMFGGLGIFRHGLMFGLVADGRVCLKADEQTEQDFISEGMIEWSYDGKGKPVKMGYWYMPDRLLEEPEELKEWALKAFDVAVRADQKKSPAKRKLKE